MFSIQEVTRLANALLGGVIFGVAFFQLLVTLDKVTVFDNGPHVAAGAAGLGLGLLRYAGPACRATGGR